MVGSLIKHYKWRTVRFYVNKKEGDRIYGLWHYWNPDRKRWEWLGCPEDSFVINETEFEIETEDL